MPQGRTFVVTVPKETIERWQWPARIACLSLWLGFVLAVIVIWIRIRRRLPNS